LEDLEALDDVGPEIAYNVIEYFNDDTNKDLL
jgi:NAD-dependent DNA ligase